MDNLNPSRQAIAETSRDILMNYFASPAQREAISAIPSVPLVVQAINFLQIINPRLLNEMLRSYNINTRTQAQLRELTAQLIEQNQAVLLNPENQSLFKYTSCFQFRLYIGKIELALGPKFECNFPFNYSNTSFNFSATFDHMAKGGGSGLKGSISLGKGSLKAAITGGTDFSLSNLERSLVVQTNVPNHSNVGLQVKDDFSKDVYIVNPSNIGENGCVMLARNTKTEGVETEATLCVLPFKTIKKKIANRLKSRKNKQSEKSLQFVEAEAETKQAEGEARAQKEQAEGEARAQKEQAEGEARAQKEQAEGEARAQKEQLQGEPCVQLGRVQKVQFQIIQPAPVTLDLVRERKSTIFKLALLTALVCLFFFFLKKLKSFLETKRLR